MVVTQKSKDVFIFEDFAIFHLRKGLSELYLIRDEDSILLARGRFSVRKLRGKVGKNVSRLEIYALLPTIFIKKIELIKAQ